MSETQEWPRIAVVGAGAVGGYFGGMFARAGAPIVLIGRKHFADAVNSKGLILDKSEGQERIKAKATVDMREVSFIADVAVLPRWIRVSQLVDYVAGVHPQFDRPKAENFLARTTIKRTSKVRELSKGMVAQLHLAIVMSRQGRKY